MLVHLADRLVPARHQLRVLVAASPLARPDTFFIGADFIASRAAVGSIASSAAVPRPPPYERPADIASAAAAAAATTTAGRGNIVLGRPHGH